jgi:hypothetical protein
MAVTLMALHEAPVPLTHASERDHETVTADRALMPPSVVRAGKAAF